MKLQKQKTRVVKGKEYYRWVVVLPRDQLEELEWQEGEKLDAEIKGESLVLRKSAR